MAPSRKDIVTAALAAGGSEAALDVIRLQSLVFLIDEVVSERIGGPFFSFEPYHYGPFDHQIIAVISAMVTEGDACIDASGTTLTRAGRHQGDAMLCSFPEPVADYFQRAARWVRFVPLRPMLAAIDREFPEMTANNKIRLSRARRPTRSVHPFVLGMAQALNPPDALLHLSESHTSVVSDEEAIADIWHSVGDDVEAALIRLAQTERLW